MIKSLLKVPNPFFNRIHTLIVSLFFIFFVQGVLSFIEVKKIINNYMIPAEATVNLNSMLTINLIIGFVVALLGAIVYVLLWFNERKRIIKIKNKIDDNISRISICSMIKESIYNK